MCGRYTLSTNPKLVAKVFAVPEIPDLPPRYNVAPSQAVAVVRAGGPPLFGRGAMKQYCYVVVLSNGTACWTRVLTTGSEATGERTWDEDNLSRLLHAGWQPVRETPMGNGNKLYAYSLIVLAKD
jgi:hypothetical protein